MRPSLDGVVGPAHTAPSTSHICRVTCLGLWAVASCYSVFPRAGGDGPSPVCSMWGEPRTQDSVAHAKASTPRRGLAPAHTAVPVTAAWKVLAAAVRSSVGRASRSPQRGGTSAWQTLPAPAPPPPGKKSWPTGHLPFSGRLAHPLLLIKTPHFTPPPSPQLSDALLPLHELLRTTNWIFTLCGICFSANMLKTAPK